MRVSSKIQIALVIVVACAGPSLAGPFTIDFDLESLSHGTLVGDQYSGVFPGVTIRGVNAVRDTLTGAQVAAEETAPLGGLGAQNWAVIWDTDSGDTSDRDLLPPFIPDTDFDNVLIINENEDGCDTHASGDTCTDPDDEGVRLRNPDVPSGFFQFDFDKLVTLSSIDFIDIEIEEDDGTPFSEILFFGDGVGGLTLLATEQVPNTGGDNMWTTLDFDDVSGVRRLIVEMGGSGAIDNIVGRVPEPSTWVLMGLGTLALVARRRRR